MSALTTGISHVGLTVPDINKTVAFFEALGFSKVGGSESYPSVFLSDGTVMMTVWAAKTESPVPFDRTKNVGLHHLAIKVPTLEALRRAYEVAKGFEGVKVEFAPREILGTKLNHAICYEPGGVRIEFTHHED